MRSLTVGLFVALAFCLGSAPAAEPADAPPLNPLLTGQKPGTWQKLPIKGDAKPQRIHAHAGGDVDPETSVLHFFGSDNHFDVWNNDVWSYDPAAMTWKQSYPQDAPETYRYQDGVKVTTAGRPWAFHTFAMNVWDPAGRQLIVGAHQMHYGVEKLTEVRMPPDATESWWLYDPTAGRWTPTTASPDLGTGHLCYLPRLRRVIGFNGGNAPVTLFDPEKKTFEPIKGQRPYPSGHTLRTAYDAKRDRLLLISWDKGPNVWAFDIEKKEWSNLNVKGRPEGHIYGSWVYDPEADVIVSIWPDDPKGGFQNPSRQGRTFIVDFEENAYKEVKTDPVVPYDGMTFKVFYDPRHKVIFNVVGNDVWSFKTPGKLPGTRAQD
jgi:hypothetical protein